MSPTVLLYALSASRFTAVSALCQAQGVLPRQVAPEDYAVSIGALLGFPAPPAEGGGAVLEEMAVLCGFTPEGLDAFLAAFSATGEAPIALKAVLTPTNAGWTGGALYRELLRERQSMEH